MGYILLLCSNFHVFAERDESKSIKMDFLLSYFITSIIILILVLFPNQFERYKLSELIGVGICYFFNGKIMFKIMKSPKYIKFEKSDDSSFGKFIIAAISLVGMIIVNLYLGVCIANVMGSSGYSNNPTFFDLFYYTVVTFTTIGFGDIIPITPTAKFMTIVISFTSIVCLTIFLGSLYSYRDNR